MLNGVEAGDGVGVGGRTENENGILAIVSLLQQTELLLLQLP